MSVVVNLEFLLELTFLNLSETSPDAVGTILGNGEPGSPSDDEELPHPSSSSHVMCGPSPTGSEEGPFVMNGICCYGDNTMWREPGQLGAEDLRPVALRGHTDRQVSLNDYLDALEAPACPGDRLSVGPLPKLRSSFPTDTRLNAMLHIDSDEEDDPVGQDLDQSQQSADSLITSTVPGAGQHNQEGQKVEAGSGLAEAGSSTGSQPQTEPERVEIGEETHEGASVQTETSDQAAEGSLVSEGTPTASGWSQAAAADSPEESGLECSCQEQSTRTCNLPGGPLSPIQVCRHFSDSDHS